MKAPHRPLSLLAVPLFAACAATGSGDPGPAPVQRGTEPMTNEDVLVLYSAGAENLLTDPRDAGLRDALELVDDRLIELAEQSGEHLPLPQIELAKDILLSPMSFRLDFGFSGGMTGSPFTAQLTLEGAPEEVASIAQRVAPLLQMVPLESEPAADHPGLTKLTTPAGAAYVGKNGDTFVASLGQPRSADLGLGSMGLPVGVDPDMALKVDFAKLQGPINMGLAAAGKEGEAIRSQLEMYGILGPNPLSLVFAAGHDDQRSYSATRTLNYRQSMEAQGLYAEGSLSAADFARVPEDATLVMLSRMEPSGMMKLIEASLEMQKEARQLPFDPFEMLKAQTGIDLAADVLGPLGQSWGFYMSNSTGGGGLASTVLFSTLDDRARLEGTMDRVEQLVLGLIADETKGYVGVSHWTHAGAACRTLAFPGLPIPLSLSVGLTDDCMYAAGSRQALAAALDQATSGGPGIASNAEVVAGAGGLDGLVSLVYEDTEALIRDGYGFATLLSAALENGVGSPVAQRGPTMVLPTFEDLVAGAQPYVATSRWEGDDLVAYGQGDRSVLANVTALLGTPFPMLVAAGAAGIGMGVVQQRTRHEFATLEEYAPPIEEGPAPSPAND